LFFEINKINQYLFLFLSKVLNWLRNLPVDKLEEYTEPLLSASISLILDSRFELLLLISFPQKKKFKLFFKKTKRSEGKISRLFGDIWEILCVAIPQKVRIATINLLVNYHNVMRGNSNENSQSSEYRSSFSFSTYEKSFKNFFPILF